MRLFCIALLLATTFCMPSICLGQRLSQKEMDEVLETQLTTLYSDYTYRLVQGIAQESAQTADLDSVQLQQLSDMKQWQPLLNTHRDSVIAFATGKQFSKKDKAEACHCIVEQIETEECKDMLLAIGDNMGYHLNQLYRHIKLSMNDQVLNNNWIPDNATPENCAPLKAGKFYYYLPDSEERIYLERKEDLQIEKHKKELFKLKIEWLDYRRYRLIGIYESEQFEPIFVILNVQPGYYIYKFKVPAAEGAPVRYDISRIYRDDERS